MPRIHLTDRNKRILQASLAFALGMAVVAIVPSDTPEQRDQKLEALGSALQAGSALSPSDKLDTAEYHRAVRAVRATRPDVTDLLTAPVEPGAEVTAEVVLAAGARVVEVEYVGPAAGKFSEPVIEHEDRDDGTLVKVTAKNTSQMRMRMTALVEVAQP